jgi:hypothetical protein
MDKIEDILILCATTVFIGMSVVLIAQIPWGTTPGQILPWLPLGILCFLFAIVTKELSPRNRGRILREVLKHNQNPISAEQFAEIQDKVGSAGFFNRIGLTGIPLAVALLALILSGLVFAATRLEYGSVANAFLNMTTVAIGAFVGTLTTGAGSRSDNNP